MPAKDFIGVGDLKFSPNGKRLFYEICIPIDDDKIPGIFKTVIVDRQTKQVKVVDRPKMEFSTIDWINDDEIGFFGEKMVSIKVDF